MEQDFFVGYYNFAGKQRVLTRILGKLRESDLPSIPSFTIYLQALHRRDVSACTLRTVFTGVHGFLVFLQKRGKSSLSSLTVGKIGDGVDKVKKERNSTTVKAVDLLDKSLNFSSAPLEHKKGAASSGTELATPLNHWSRRGELNSRPADYEAEKLI